MFILPKDATDDQFRDAAREWVELFAANRLAEASAFLAAAPDSPVWSPRRIKTEISKFKPDHACYGNESPRITSCADAKVIREFGDPELDQPAHLVVHWIPTPATTGKYPGRIGEVMFELPINGYWSRAAAVFFIRELADGLALELRCFLVENAED